LENTSSNELAQRLLDACIRQNPWDETALGEDELDELIRRALSPDEELARIASRALFTTLVEPLADLFAPHLCDAYTSIFARVLSQALPGLDAAALGERYRRVREVRGVPGQPATVFVLSRVTLGADVAITSLFLDAAKERFPSSRIVLAGPRKAWELFERDPRLSFAPVEYSRSNTLAGRLSAFPRLCELLSEPDSVLLDPDSRLTQLGLLPVCPEERHFLFESRRLGGDSGDSLPAIARRWLDDTLGVRDARPYLATKFVPPSLGTPYAAVSLGVGENPAKRVADPFEPTLLCLLSERFPFTWIDLGVGGEEAERVRNAIATAALPEGKYGLHEGSFASFASIIAGSGLYTGYDSAGQHVAAALGVPLITVFAGHLSDRMFQRWSPDGPGPRTIIQVSTASSTAIIGQVIAALDG
jgi:ADP-heptose:LPS heptosyltransferase